MSNNKSSPFLKEVAIKELKAMLLALMPEISADEENSASEYYGHIAACLNRLENDYATLAEVEEELGIVLVTKSDIIKFLHPEAADLPLAKIQPGEFDNE